MRGFRLRAGASHFGLVVARGIFDGDVVGKIFFFFFFSFYTENDVSFSRAF